MENTLYYGDNLPILRQYIPDNSIDLIYLDPPFNSKKDYNLLFKEPTGELSQAQITAFHDTWHWGEEAERTYQEILEIAPPKLIDMMSSFRSFIRENDIMAYLTMMAIRLLELKRVLRNTGSIYLHCNPAASHYLKILMDTIFDKRNFRNEIAWCYFRPSSPKQKCYNRVHDTLLFYTNSHNFTFNADAVRVPYSKESIARAKRGVITSKIAKGGVVLKPGGKHPEDWWYIPQLRPNALERLGYPTQKPEALLEIIIKASSTDGNTVLDPFCGCGTATAVAHKLNRNWIGIDITHLAINLIKRRLKGMFGLNPKMDYNIIGEPEDLAGAKELASQNRYQFQWWASSLIGAHPYGNKKKGADKGIDAIFYFSDEKGKNKKVIVQVKSGKVGVKDIRDFSHVTNREKAEIGIFITLETPTSDMEKEAIINGFYESPIDERKYQKIQIKTIEKLLENPSLDLDFYRPTMFKKATTRDKEQFELNV